MYLLSSNKAMPGAWRLPPYGGFRELRGTEANCGNGPGYFAYLSSSNTSLLNYLRDGSQTNTATVRMNYCKPSETLFGNLSAVKTYQVTGSIVSTQNILNGFAVRYKAGTFIELNDGFVSGSDFVAEIDPCIISRTTIAAKTDDVEEMQEYFETTTINENIQIKVYPTVLPSGNSINVVTSRRVNNVTIVVYDLNSKPVTSKKIAELNANMPNQLELPALSSGFYIVNVHSDGLFFTQKIIIQ